MKEGGNQDCLWKKIPLFQTMVRIIGLRGYIFYLLLSSLRGRMNSSLWRAASQRVKTQSNETLLREKHMSFLYQRTVWKESWGHRFLGSSRMPRKNMLLLHARMKVQAVIIDQKFISINARRNKFVNHPESLVIFIYRWTPLDIFLNRSLNFKYAIIIENFDK